MMRVIQIKPILIQRHKKSLQPIIIQGALPVESERNGIKTKQFYSRNVRWMDVLERNLSRLSSDYL
jgi:hypothetical protein